VSVGVSQVDSGDDVSQFQPVTFDPGVGGVVPDPNSGVDTTVEDKTTSFNGTLSLIRNTSRTQTSLSYRRQTRPSSGFGSDVNVDNVAAQLTARLSRRLEMETRVSWSHVESATDAVADLFSPISAESPPFDQDLFVFVCRAFGVPALQLPGPGSQRGSGRQQLRRASRHARVPLLL
jgi:hypothetical protein